MTVPSDSQGHAAIGVLLKLEEVGLPVEGRGRMYNLWRYRRRRGVRHLDLVGALAGIGPRRDVVGPALGCREGQPAVVALAPVVVRRTRNEIAVGIVDAAQIGIAQRAVTRGAASQDR